jgi:8-amino-7-oxononanoate synthase
LPTPAWIDKWLAACQDLAELERSNPMTDAVVEKIDGRMIRVGEQWLARSPATGSPPRPGS